MRYLKYTCRIRKFKAFEPAYGLLKRTFCYKRCVMSLYRPIKAQYSANVVAASVKPRIFRMIPCRFAELSGRGGGGFFFPSTVLPP